MHRRPLTWVWIAKSRRRDRIRRWWNWRPRCICPRTGKHLVLFANQARRLQREEVDLSTTITWEAWQTDLSAAGREELVSTKLPDCRCKNRKLRRELSSRRGLVARYGRRGSVSMTQYVAGQTAPIYKTVRYTRSRAESGLPHPWRNLCSGCLTRLRTAA